MEQFSSTGRILATLTVSVNEITMLPFNDRADAGRRLAGELRDYAQRKPVVFALPRGGVPVAAEICRILEAPLDVVMVRKIGVPTQPELALGAVVDGDEPEIVLNEDIARRLRYDDDRIAALAEVELAEIERRRRRYGGGSAQSLSIDGRTAIVVDDGIATGATVRAALKALRKRQPAFLILAVPIAPPDVLALLEREADAVLCLSSPRGFRSVGEAYIDFDQVSDEMVTTMLAEFEQWQGN
jgi:predicted phosphoribosyltransferase